MAKVYDEGLENAPTVVRVVDDLPDADGDPILLAHLHYAPAKGELYWIFQPSPRSSEAAGVRIANTADVVGRVGASEEVQVHIWQAAKKYADHTSRVSETLAAAAAKI